MTALKRRTAIAVLVALIIVIVSLWTLSSVAHEVEIPPDRSIDEVSKQQQQQQHVSSSRAPSTTETGDATASNHGFATVATTAPPPAVRGAAELHFITVQTKASPLWCRMLLSAHLSGVAVHNLAWNHNYAHNKRPRWILDWIAERKASHSLRDSDVVMFGDGGDTMFSGKLLASVLANFESATDPSSESSDRNSFGPHTCQSLRMGSSGSCRHAPLIFNAEANCYHQLAFSGSWGVKKGRCLAAYKRHDPNVTSRYRYLNAGAWIGRVWAVVKVFETAKAIIDRDGSLWCDQSVLGSMYLNNDVPGLIGLDIMNAYFLPTYHLRVAVDFCAAASGNVSDGQPRMQMCHSGNIPTLIHFNGKSEGSFTADVIRRAAWFSSNSKEQSDRVSAAKDGTVELHASRGSMRQRIGDVCPKLLFPQ